MNLDHIVIRRTETGSGYYTVEADGRMCTYLCWGEMIEMLIHLTHSDIKGPRYHWRTVDEEMAEEKRRAAPVAKVNPLDENLLEIQPFEKPIRRYTCGLCQTISDTPLNVCSRADCEQIPF